MKEKLLDLTPFTKKESKPDSQPIVEVLGKIREISIGKRANIDRTRFIPLD